MCPHESARFRFSRAAITISIYFVFCISIASCSKDMAVEAKLKPQNHEAPPPVAGTVSNDRLTDSGEFISARAADEPRTPPPTATLDFLKRGQKSYEIHCLPCHDRAGTGNGILIERGFKKPSPLDALSIRQKSDSEIFRDISEGKGTMAGYRGMVSPENRWALVAYVRVLQLSRHMPASALDREDLEMLAKEKGP